MTSGLSKYCNKLFRKIKSSNIGLLTKLIKIKTPDIIKAIVNAIKKGNRRRGF
jgi:hypothetical protein